MIIIRGRGILDSILLEDVPFFICAWHLLF